MSINSLSLIYDYCDIDIRLLEYFVKIINILFQKGFVCVDISPRNVIIYQTQNEVCYQLIDFEKSYFLPVDEIERKKSKLMRGQFCGEELAVLLDMKTIKQLFGADYDPDNWDITDSNILYEPYRPEVHDILIGRKMNTYTVGIYNQVEKEVHNVVKPNRNARYIGTELELLVDSCCEEYVHSKWQDMLSFFGKLSPLIYDALFIDVVFRMHNATFECDDDKLVNRWLKVLFCIENSYT